MFILEAITIVGFLALLFVSKLSWRTLLSFILIAASVYVIESYNLDNFAEAELIMVAATLFWALLIRTDSFVTALWKTVLTNLMCLIGVIVIQIAWIPFYLYVMGLDLSYVTANEFLFGLPCRLVEYVILFLIYSFKVKPIIASKALVGLAKGVANPASIWWVYQPKTPKGMK